jgi:hypothetical protein
MGKVASRKLDLQMWERLQKLREKAEAQKGAEANLLGLATKTAALDGGGEDTIGMGALSKLGGSGVSALGGATSAADNLPEYNLSTLGLTNPSFQSFGTLTK